MTINEIFAMIKDYFEKLKAVLNDAEANDGLDFFVGLFEPIADVFGDRKIGK